MHPLSTPSVMVLVAALVVAWCLGASITHICAETFGAFCKKDATIIDKFSRAHPSDVPTDINSPWVWEAVYRDVSTSGVLQVTIVPRWACHFSEQAWFEAFAMLPQHSKQLAEGRKENVLVPTFDVVREDVIRLMSDVEWRFQEAKRGKKKGKIISNETAENTDEMLALKVELASLQDKRFFAMMGERLGCMFYTLSEYFEFILVGSSVSEPIQGRPTWMAAASVEVFCPVPPMPPGTTFEYIRVNRTFWGKTIITEAFSYCRYAQRSTPRVCACCHK